MDKTTLARIELLHPNLRDEARQIYTEICAALTGRAMCRFTFTLRTMQEQAALFNLGRTVKNPDGASAAQPLGNIVTNARAGYSLHNFGLAIDIALIIDGKVASWDRLTDFDGDKVADWMECVRIFKAHGWEWGGDWKSFKDYPHFQKTFGKSLQELRSMQLTGKLLPDSIYLKF